MSTRKLKIGIIGCGNIAGAYARDIVTIPQVELAGAADLDVTRAQSLVDQYGGVAYPSVEAMLDDRAIDLVMNLTTHHAHKAVTTQCLEAGKHVHSEKPLAITYGEGKALVELARQKGLQLSCAPFTLMGEAQQTAWKWIRDGRLGKVRVVYAEVNWGRIETWHPEPRPFYEVGALFDVGVYPLSIITAIFGPARSVTSYGRVVLPDRVTQDGESFHVATPDFLLTMIEFANGTLVRLTTNFYVGQHSKQGGIEFHGDLGSVYVASWHMFSAAVEFAEFGQQYRPVPLVREPQFKGLAWSYGITDMAQSIIEGRPTRFTGEHAAHVLELLCAATESAKSGQPVKVYSDFTPPRPMDWAV